ncbi:MAG: signal recognition particle receptor subunit alpha, partial [FCB group bacterium]|nr:signal recognition particle receptor subunit alpha [FCB group bacterium]
MFDELSEKLDGFFRKIRGRGKLTEANIKESLREVRRIMLSSDVNFKVVKQFIAEVEERALGTDVLKSITPGQMVVKIINDRLIELLGGMRAPLDISGDPPVPLMVVGLQGSGKTTFCGKLAKRLLKKGKKPMLVAVDIFPPPATHTIKVVGGSFKNPVFFYNGSVYSHPKGGFLV